MNNILDYINWRGDITLKYDAFNDVDNLILSILSHVDFGELLERDQQELTIRDAYQKLLVIQTDSLEHPYFATGNVLILLQKMAGSKRYGDMRLSCYESQLDEEAEKQFSALMIRLGDGTVYISFRGTDDTLIGWKENFNMSYRDCIPAQLEGVHYLNIAPVKLFEKIRIGGHSKGGNIAIYAAVHCNRRIKNKIIRIYSNDAPGFRPELVQSRGYQELLPKIRALVPQDSFVGMLLEHGEAYHVIHSSGKGLMQHDAFTWDVEGNSFISLPDISQDSKITKSVVNAWISGMNSEEKEELTLAFFEFIRLSGESVSNFLSGKIKINHILHAGFSMDKKRREQLVHNIKTLLYSIHYEKNKYKNSYKRKEKSIQNKNGLILS